MDYTQKIKELVETIEFQKLLIQQWKDLYMNQKESTIEYQKLLKEMENR